jgi:hypothetical protein
MAASLPFVLFGYDYIQCFHSHHRLSERGYYTDLFRNARQTLKRHLVFYLLLFLLVPLSIFYYVSIRHAFLMVSSGQVEWWGGSVSLNFLNAAYLFIHYIKKLFLPVVLVADNSEFPLIRSFYEIKSLASIAVLLLLCLLVLLFMNRKKSYFFALLFFMATLLPVMHLIPHHEFMAEHYLYLPSFGFCLFLGLVFQGLIKENRKIFRSVAVLFVLISLIFSARTLLRNQDWTNEFTIYHKDLQAYPENKRVHLVLGKAYMDSFEYERAMAEFSRAVEGDRIFLW